MEAQNLSGLEPKLIKLEFIIYLPKLKVNSQLKIMPKSPFHLNFIKIEWAKPIQTPIEIGATPLLTPIDPWGFQPPGPSGHWSPSGSWAKGP